MLLGLNLKLPQPVPATTALGPRLLFQSGEQGGWWDPSDFSTLFQDAAGTTPVTAVEQPCSLMLDKRLGLTLGSELVTNGDFSGGTTGWTAVGLTIAVVSGELQMTRTGSSQYVYQTLTTVSGKRYSVTFNYRNGTTSSAVYVGSTVGGVDLLPATTVSSAQTASFTFSFLATGTASTISWGLNALGGTAFIDNISVRELPGNHAYTPAAASTARPTVSARYNEYIKTEELSDVAWQKVDSTASGNVLSETATTQPHYVEQTRTLSNSVTYRMYCKAKPNTQTYMFLGLARASSGAAASVEINLTTGAESRRYISGAGWAASTPVISGFDADGFRTISVDITVGTSSTSESRNFFGLSNGVGGFDSRGRPVYAGDVNNNISLKSFDFRVSNDGVGLPPYQRVNTATDYDAGPQWPPYLRADGSNDYMLTNSIDFSATDKMTVCAGVRKLSPGDNSILETYTTTTSEDTFRSAVSTVFIGTLTGSSSFSSVTGPTTPTPSTNVVTWLFDKAGASASDQIQVRQNGILPAQTVSAAGPAGSLPFDNLPIYFFSRSGTSLFYNGRFYGGVVRGAQSNTQQIAALEGYMNSKTAAF